MTGKPINMTERARYLGWSMPESFRIEATAVPDPHAQPTDYQCYTTADIQAWRRGDWQLCTLTLRVIDTAGRQWATVTVDSCEHGLMPERYVDLFADIDDVINEACTKTIVAIGDLINQFTPLWLHKLLAPQPSAQAN